MRYRVRGNTPYWRDTANFLYYQCTGKMPIPQENLAFILEFIAIILVVLHYYSLISNSELYMLGIID
ncbi:MAG: hypothetical protein V7L05_32765 [Nostoc sp.]|uniref:hypothetical protein n=1 Tax=Nostoc sp. TaxID=1180 RepID=UPI002FFA5D6A